MQNNNIVNGDTSEVPPEGTTTAKTQAPLIPEVIDTTQHLSKSIELGEQNPVEAAKNINNAKFMEISPDSYSNHSEDFDKMVNTQRNMPLDVNEGLRDYLSQSEQHRSVASSDGDLDMMAFMENRVKFYKSRLIDIPSKRREANDIRNKFFTHGENSLTEFEKDKLDDLDNDIELMSKETYGVDNVYEQTAGEVLGAAGDIARTYTDNKLLLGATALTVAAGTAVFGAPAAGLITATATTTSGIVSMFDAYVQTRNNTFKDLGDMKGDDGKALDFETKKSVSQGVGMFSGLLGFFGGKLLAKSNPLFNKMAVPATAKKLLSKSPTVLARTKLLGAAAESVVTEGGEEALQEYVQVIGTEFAKMDETEGSFINALTRSASPETLDRVLHAGFIGGLSGGVFTGATGSLSLGKLKTEFEQAQTKVKSRENTLAKQNQILEVAHAMKNTKLNDLSPEEMTKYKNKLYENLGEDRQSLHVDLDDLRTFAGEDPKRQQDILNLIDKSGKLNATANELNITITMDEADAVDLAKDHPDITDYLKLTPEGDKPLDIRNDAQDLLTRMNEAEVKRKQLKEELGVVDLPPEAEQEIQKIVNPPKPDKPDIKNEQDFLNNIEFPHIEGVVSKEQVENLNTLELDLRKEVSDQYKAENDKKFNRIEDKIFKDISTKELNEDLKKVQKEHLIIKNFKVKKDTSEGSNSITKNHTRKGFSAVAIDPASLTVDQRKSFLEIPEIKKHLDKRKVFVKGGVSVEESAVMLGVSDGNELLRLLTETPDEKTIKERRKFRDLVLRQRTRETIAPAKETARDAKFTSNTKNLIRQMKVMASTEYNTVRRGVIKIAGKPPTVDGLKRKAKNLIGGTKVRDINRKRFERGRSRSMKKALDAWTATKFEESYKQVEATALNNEIARESESAQDRITKNENFWKNTKKKSFQNTLKKAGALDAFNELLDVYNMNKTNKNGNEIKNFQKFIKEKLADGDEFVPNIPDRLSDTTTHYKDMTVDEYQAITDLAKYIEHKAKRKNQVVAEREGRIEKENLDAIRDDIETSLRSHPDYNPNGAGDGKMSDAAKLASDTYQTVFGGNMETMKSIATQLGFEKLQTAFYKHVVNPVVEARTNKRVEMSNIEANDIKTINTYGMHKFNKMFNTFIDVPELRDIHGFHDFGNGMYGNGRIRKVDLLVMQAYRGDPEGRRSLGNFVNIKDGTKLPLEKIEAILERELDESDASLVQALLSDRWKNFKDRTTSLNKRTTGIESNTVEGVSYTHRGIEREGGYYPIKRTFMPINDVLEREQIKLQKPVDVSEEGDSEAFARRRSAEMTDQGRSKERTGSDRPLDVTFENMFDFTEEFLHDLHFREVGINGFKILKNKDTLKDMHNIIGQKQTNLFVDHFRDIISKESDRPPTLFNQSNAFFTSVINKANHLHAMKVIGFNPQSAAVQPVSLINLTQRVGPKTGLYLFKAGKKMLSNPSKMKEFYRVAELVNPDLKLDKDGTDNTVIKSSYTWIQKTKRKTARFFGNTAAKRSSEFSKFSDTITSDYSFSMLRELDRFNKVLGTVALTEQFLAGDIEGFDIDTINKMSAQELKTKMNSTIKQALDLSLTASAPEDKSAIEKNSNLNWFVRYFADRRSRFNTQIAQGRKARGHFKQGDYRKAAVDAAMIPITSAMTRAWMGIAVAGVGGLVTGGVSKAGRQIEDFYDEFTEDFLWNSIKAPVNEAKSLLPGIDSISYAADLQRRSDYRNVSVPITNVASDIAMFPMSDVLESIRKLEAPKLSEVDRRALLNNLGYMAGGFPTNALWKLRQYSNSTDFKKNGIYLKQAYTRFNDEVNAFIDTFKDDPEMQEFNKQLGLYRDENLPTAYQDSVGQDTSPIKEAIKSSNTWRSVNKKTGGAGLYQFTEEKWDEVTELAPELGLTEDGRTSKDQSEQEKAIDWVMQDNKESLKVFEVPVTNQTLYGAYLFGAEDFSRLYKSKPDKKLSSFLKNNPTDFKNVKEVMNFLKKIDNNE